MSKPLKGFITYSHKDTAAKDGLRERLAVMEQKNEFITWHDGEITAGDEWYEDISKNLAEADILLYLVSAASLASKNCNKELAEALENKTKVIPIILEHCDWMHHELSGFEVLPLKGKPISKWGDPSEGWQNVVDGIRAAINKMQVQAKPSPSITPEEVEILSKLIFQKGNFLMMLDQMDEAAEAYSRAIELNPNHAASYNNRGIAYKEKGEYDRAIEDYNKAIELNPTLAEAYSNRGNAHREKGELDRTSEDCNAALELNPTLAEAYVNRGAVYGAKGEFDRALEDCNKAIGLNPNFPEAYSNRGNAYRERGEMDKALKDCNKAIGLNPNYVGAYINRGGVYHQKGRIDLAIADYTTAIDLEPGLTEAYVNLGVAYCQKDEFGSAIEAYSEAIHINPNFVMAYYCRAFVCLHLREWDEASSLSMLSFRI